MWCRERQLLFYSLRPWTAFLLWIQPHRMTKCFRCAAESESHCSSDRKGPVLYKLCYYKQNAPGEKCYLWSILVRWWEKGNGRGLAQGITLSSQKVNDKNWTGSSEVKITGCSCRGTDSGSQPSVLQFQGIQCTFLTSVGIRHAHGTHACK